MLTKQSGSHLHENLAHTIRGLAISRWPALVQEAQDPADLDSGDSVLTASPPMGCQAGATAAALHRRLGAFSRRRQQLISFLSFTTSANGSPWLRSYGLCVETIARRVTESPSSDFGQCKRERSSLAFASALRP